MNYQNDDDYELASDIEMDLFLVDMPMNVIRESLRYQIQNPLSTNVNYVDTVTDLVASMREQYADNPEVISNINDFVCTFFEFLINELNDRFDTAVNTEMFEAQQYLTVGPAMYRFLILRYKKNVTKFIYKFITKNKKMLVDEFAHNMKKKDVTTIATKKTVKNKDDALIISNLPSVVSYIMGTDFDVSTFLQYLNNDDLYDITILQRLMDEGTMIGNFVSSYLSIAQVEYDMVMDEIMTDVRLKLMKKNS